MLLQWLEKLGVEGKPNTNASNKKGGSKEVNGENGWMGRR